jgi:rod shape-determining protein MreD
MVLRRSAISVLLVGTALVLQTTVVTRLGFPGAPPDLTLLVILALALVYGPTGGAIVGFLGGLAADVVPPVDHQIGRYAFVFCLVGYLAGLGQRDEERSALHTLLVVGATAVLATALYAGLAALLGDVRVWGATFSRNVPASALYDLLLAPFVVPAVMFLARRFEPEVVRW